ncbi:MAG: response regulator transcription factor [Bacteroidia bacterium]|nr:response regulator transcription factor [Bacteroidia bacterium]
MKKKRIFLVDDHRMILDGLQSLLENDDHFETAGTYTSAAEAIKYIDSLKPDFIITDISMPGMNGIEFTAEVKKKYPHIKIIALTMSGDAGMIEEMTAAGISGYVLKNTGRKELKESLEKVSSGEMFYSTEAAAAMLMALRQQKKLREEEEKAHLTPREKEIIKLIAQEYSNAMIAESLFISERTVETHRKNIFRKTNTKNIVGLIKYAMEHKLI